jgi:NAD(P)-dependent dehydrogenase (short-subunit alcohol dehydrogenase family)
MGKLDGKIALVTGGSEGIGLAIATLFITEGAHVFITGRRKDALEQAVKQIPNGNMISAIQADSSRMEDIDKVYKQIEREKGRLDILVANAAFSEFLPMGSITEQHFDQSFNTNVKGILFSVQSALPIFSNGGTIILIGSVASVKTAPGLSVYSATKAALQAFARCWSLDLKDRQIRVNIISPGPINTAKHQACSEEIMTFVKSKLVIDRLGESEEVAKSALFLASSVDSGYITGIELFVDGGTTIM